ncbi:TPA: hypothetical protein QCR38_003872 [Bacillus cereus]|nr:hypothetical protein [Bacillus cereus]
MSIDDNFTTPPGHDLEDEFTKEELEDDETIDEVELDEHEKENKSILYQSRVKSLIKSVADSEGYDIQIGKKGFTQFNESITFITVMLAYEIIEELKVQKRKKITPPFVDKALSKILGRADALSLAIKELEQVLETLEVKSSTTSISKAMDYLNILMEDEQEGIENGTEIAKENVHETK